MRLFNNLVRRDEFASTAKVVVIVVQQLERARGEIRELKEATEALKNDMRIAAQRILDLEARTK